MYPAYDIWSPPEEDQKLHSESEAWKFNLKE